MTGLDPEKPPEPTAASRASGSSFYAGMKALPKPEREAMYAVYAFCRQVDDVADDQGSAPEFRRAQLETWRRGLRALYEGGDPGPAASLAPYVRQFDLELDDFLAVVDGMEMDVDEDIRAPSMDTLDLYCDRVASAVGRLSVRIFGMERETGRALAHHLGRALQLTNILRDLDEDAEIGRLYLPRELLDAAGIEDDDPWSVVDDPRVDIAAHVLAERALDHYREADRILSAKPAGKLIAPRLMEAVYSRILKRTAARGWAPPRKRVSIARPELMWLVLTRGLLG